MEFAISAIEIAPSQPAKAPVEIRDRRELPETTAMEILMRVA